MKTTARIAAWLLLAAFVASAQAERVTVGAGQSLTFNFDLSRVRTPPLPPFTGVTLATGVDRRAGGEAAVATWQVFAGHDGSGALLLTASQELASKDLFGVPFRYGRFSVRLSVASGALSVDPTVSAFRNYGREIGVEYGEAYLPDSVTPSPR